MADVQILGAGFAGLFAARALREAGASVRLVDPRAFAGGPGRRSASGAAAGVVLPCPPEHLHRLEAAVGVDVGAELCAFLAAGARDLPGFRGCGVRWRVAGPEVAETDASFAAAARLGVRAERTEDGFHLHEGGEVDLVALRAALACPVETAPGEADVTIVAAGWESANDPFLGDKLLPARWQATRYAADSLPWPVVSQHANVFWANAARGGLVAFGARWATPHLEVGETEPLCEPRVTALLDVLTRRAVPQVGPACDAWAGVVAESCDQLPIVGPIPGRPRTLAFTGFGVLGLAAMAGAARALARGLMTGDDAGLPALLRTSRFR